MRRVLLAVLICVVTVFGVAVPCFAHTEFEPATADANATVAFNLFVEGEQPNAGTSKVRLAFPEGVMLVVVDVPPPAGWTVTIDGGSVGGPASGITWEGGPEPGDVNFPLTLGPLPATAGRLQFKVLQTYDNGVEDAWIDDWPVGAEEPPTPGPVVDITASAESAPSTTATTSTTASSLDQTAAETTPAPRDDSSTGLIIAIVAAVVILGLGGFFFIRSRRS